MRTPAEELAATLQQLDTLMPRGAIDAETHGRAIAEAYREAEQAADRMLASSRDWQDGVRRGHWATMPTRRWMRRAPPSG